jgi:uncharacterized membrane protein
VNTLVMVLRLLHILSGVFWAGSAILFGFVISPAISATAEAGQKVLAHLVTKARISATIAYSAILTVLAGGGLYWIDSQGFTSPWQRSGPGVGFGIGGLAALVALVFGLLVGKNTNILGRVAAEIHGKPSPEQLTRIRAAAKQLGYAGPISSTAVLIALVCMATARYWAF